jgi:uncharacterized protein (DUF2235 family)
LRSDTGSGVPGVRNLVVCSDGTGNTFRQRESNVSRLVRGLDLTHPGAQLVFYDQGIGTNPSLVAATREYRDEAGKGRTGLEILDPPRVRLSWPLATLAGLVAGYGLRANIKEMYGALAKNHRPEDRIFLVGFSRGAFTVRALAGLLYRCGLPPAEVARDDEAFRCCFSEAYELYRPHCEDWPRIRRFKSAYRAADVEVHFLGLWDTVKSYGGVRPRSLPHLRHNPIVKTVCHALALDERRSWFLPTSWGGIDADARNAGTLRDDPRYARQRIEEVWFRGCHSDVGGGDREARTAMIALRWMLGEATRECLILDPECDGSFFSPDPEPQLHESYGLWWRLSDLIPRWELDNSTRPPGYPLRWPGRGKRCVEPFRRGGLLRFHSTVGIGDGPGVVRVETRRPLLPPAGHCTEAGVPGDEPGRRQEAVEEGQRPRPTVRALPQAIE